MHSLSCCFENTIFQPFSGHFSHFSATFPISLVRPKTIFRPCFPNFGLRSALFGGSQKGGFQKGGFGGCPPGTKTGTRVHSPKPPFWKPPFYLPVSLFGVDKRVVSKRVVLADVPPERKPERGYIRQNHPFTKPPFYLPVNCNPSARGALRATLRCKPEKSNIMMPQCVSPASLRVTSATVQ